MSFKSPTKYSSKASDRKGIGCTGKVRSSIRKNDKILSPSDGPDGMKKMLEPRIEFVEVLSSQRKNTNRPLVDPSSVAEVTKNISEMFAGLSVEEDGKASCGPDDVQPTLNPRDGKTNEEISEDQIGLNVKIESTIEVKSEFSAKKQATEVEVGDLSGITQLSTKMIFHQEFQLTGLASDVIPGIEKLDSGLAADTSDFSNERKEYKDDYPELYPCDSGTTIDGDGSSDYTGSYDDDE